MTVINKVFKKW